MQRKDASAERRPLAWQVDCGAREGGLRPDDPWQEEEAGGANWNLQNSSVERSPGGTVSAIRRIK